MRAGATIASCLAALLTFTAAAVAFDDSKYPDWGGQWKRPRGVGTQWDQTKPSGVGQQAPLTREFQAILEASIKDQEEGGFGNHRGGSCLGFGMPIIAYGFEPQEFIVTPDTTYILVNWVEHTRRIFTDGRDWPVEIEPTLTGYSIGR